MRLPFPNCLSTIERFRKDSLFFDCRKYCNDDEGRFKFERERGKKRRNEVTTWDERGKEESRGGERGIKRGKGGEEGRWEGMRGGGEGMMEGEGHDGEYEVP